jgi:hypothetical protein
MEICCFCADLSLLQAACEGTIVAHRCSFVFVKLMHLLQLLAIFLAILLYLLIFTTHAAHARLYYASEFVTHEVHFAKISFQVSLALIKS